jgi:hypothetical protein
VRLCWWCFREPITKTSRRNNFDRFPNLDDKGVAAGAAAAVNARGGDAGNIYGDGLSSWVNRRARNAGIAPGMRVIDAVARLLARA